MFKTSAIEKGGNYNSKQHTFYILTFKKLKNHHPYCGCVNVACRLFWQNKETITRRMNFSREQYEKPTVAVAYCTRGWITAGNWVTCVRLIVYAPGESVR